MQTFQKPISLIKKYSFDFATRHFAKFVLAIATGWILIDTAWTIINIYNYYNDTRVLVHNNLLLIFIVLLPITITFAYLLILHQVNRLDMQLKEHQEQFLQDNEIIRFHRNIIDDCIDDIYINHRNILEKDIKNALENENWKQVIKIGRYGSRLFLMLARYDLRIQYGNYIIKAATEISESESVAMGYIDCIGWSYVKQEKYKAAEENIKKGLQLISNLDTHESIIMKCKANRHLVNIMLIQGDLLQAKNYRDIFEKYLKKLKGKSKRIMQGSLCIINGDIIAFESQDFESAKNYYERASKLFLSCNDFERSVKVYYKLGWINEKMGQNPKALKNYILGFWMSDKLSRIDEKLNNCQGICRLIEPDNQLFQSVLSNKELETELERNEIKLVKTTEFYINELKKLQTIVHI